jgi:hypothetical protein
MWPPQQDFVIWGLEVIVGFVWGFGFFCGRSALGLSLKSKRALSWLILGSLVISTIFLTVF